MKKLLATAVVAAALPFAASSQDLSYNYVDARYANLSVSGGSNPDGFSVEASGKIADQFFIRANYLRLSGSGITADQIIAEGGLIFPMAPGIDLIGTAGLIYVDIDVSGFGSEDDTSFIVSGGARAMLTPQFELEGRVIYNDNDFYEDSDVDLDIGARFNITPEFSVGANYLIDSELVSVGARYNFGFMY